MDAKRELDWNQLLAMISSAENCAKSCGAFTILGKLAALRKSMVRSNPNRKLLRAATAQFEKLQRELNVKQR